MDRKLDDGLPSSRTIQAYGDGSFCYYTNDRDYIYDEAVGMEGCGLYIKLRE